MTPSVISVTYLNVEQCGSVSLPLLYHRHVFDHGLFLVHPLQFLPLVHHTGSDCSCLLSHPGLQAVLLLQLLPTQWATPETPPQCSLQEAGAFSFRCPWALGHRTSAWSECLGRVLHPGPQACHGEHLRHFREAGLGTVITQEVLKSQCSQELKCLLRGWILTINDCFMSL